jgi:Tfp pilus assembly pilus retraction ATPase PilT
MSDAIERFGLVLKFAGEHRLSDVLFKADSKPYYRRVGSLIARPQEQVFTQEDLAAVAQHVMAGEQMARFNAGREITLIHPLVGAGRFRIHVFRQRASIGLSVRVHPGRARPLRDLGLPAAWSQLCGRHGALVLVVGGAGQGRTTTLGALVAALNEATPARRIVTVGNCIELSHVDKSGWTAQRTIGVDAPDWPAGVRGAMAQGADVMALDDMIDGDSWLAAIEAAERGVTVIATVAARDVGTAVGQVLARIPVDKQVMARRRLAPVLVGATEQHLVPTPEGTKVAVACGLYTTESRGYALIRDGHDPTGLYEIMHSRAQGMMTADQSLAVLVGNGTIKAETALAYAARPKALR